MSQAARHLATLAGALALVWCVLAVPAWNQHGPVGLVGLAAMAVGCLLPGVVLVFFAKRFTGANGVLQALLLGTALRVVSVLAVSFVLIEARPELKSNEFFIALSLFYLVALSVETKQLIDTQAVDGGVREEGPCPAE